MPVKAHAKKSQTINLKFVDMPLHKPLVCLLL